MATQEQKQRSTSRRVPQPAEQEQKRDAEADARRAEMKAHTEELLDEIDEMLAEEGLETEEAAQDFVTNYLQKGGE